MLDRNAKELEAALEAIASGRTAHDLETQTLEFKEPKTSPDGTVSDFADAVLCLANARGGHVVLGVANRTPGTAAHLCSDDGPQGRRAVKGHLAGQFADTVVARLAVSADSAAPWPSMRS